MAGHTQGPASAGPVFDILARLTALATGAVLIGLVGLVCAEVILRGFANVSLGFAEELTGYGVVMLTFFGAALALRDFVLFQVHFVFDKLPEGARRQALRAFIVLALIVCAVLAWKTWGLMQSSMQRGKFAPTVLRTPLWIPQLLLPIGFTVIGAFLIEKLLLVGRVKEETV